MTKPYAIGLDIGTNSVGWSVVTEGYKVPAKVMKVLGNTDRKSIKKNLLGVLIFDEGQTAADYRINRITSRRYERRRNRILYLQEIFAEEMAKLDPYFFARLQESFYVQSDKEYAPQPIFAKFEEESAYHQAYPTIYHLRKELADVQEKKDIRLVYLALAHILKYRGHFLFESTEEFEHADIQETFQEFLQEYNEQFEACLKVQDVHTILTASLPKALKVDKVRDLFAGETSKGSLNHFLKLMLGYKVDFKKLFGLEESLSLQFSKDEYEEDLEALLGKVGTEYEDIFLISKRLYDAILLSGILTITDPSSKAPLSSSMVKRYKEHAEDLKSLKVWFRKYAPEQYRSMFNDKTQKGYAAYIGGLYKEDKTKGLVATSKAVSEEEFYNFTKSCLQGLPETEVFLEKIAREQFLRKQRTFDNGVIPYQIHLKELRAILKRQAVYYPFLKEAAEQIEKILTFRIPYYVGPLAKGNSRFAWLERKSDQPIRPWNFEELVDMEKSAERFIENLISKDFYLPNEYVLPANSLIYQQYLIFNELTRVYFVPEGGKRTYFSASQKEQTFNDLFKKHRKVTRKKLLDFIAYELGYGDSVGDNLEGIKDEFLSSYRTYYDLEKILGRTFLDDKDNTEILEEIIHILTVFEDRQMIEKGLQKFDTILKPAILKKLARKRYTGWGNVSRRLIDGIRNRETNKTILDYLKDDGYGNRNFMQLIQDDTLDFKDIIEKAQPSLDMMSNQDLVADLPGSPAIKKGILQSLNIVDEIIKVMGHFPSQIVIEMARENQTTQQGMAQSRKRLKQIQEGLAQLGSDLLTSQPIADNKSLQSEKLFLYYLQNGRDFYTGTDLSCDPVSLASYDVDHIIPRSIIKNDSIENKVLTSSKENRKKGSEVPGPKIIQKMQVIWQQCHRAGLMSDTKLSYLMKPELTEEDKAGFIKRQLVETRQITKQVARLLDERFNRTQAQKDQQEKAVQIITLKSAFANRFREEFSLRKIRNLNYDHHAHDAYLNVVVAQAVLKAYPNFEKELVYGSYVKQSIFSRKLSATERLHMYNNILRFISKEDFEDKESGQSVWDKASVEQAVKKVIYRTPPTIVKKREEQSGALFKQSNMAVGYNNKLVPRKKGWDVDKYGGFIEPTKAYSLAVFYQDDTGKKSKKKSMIIGIPLMDKWRYEQNPQQYLEEKGIRNLERVIKLPKYSLFEMENGRRRLLASDEELQKGNSIRLPERLIELLYQSQMLDKPSRNQRNSHYRLEEHRQEFEELMDYMEQFEDRYIQSGSNFKKIHQLYLNHKDDPIEEIARSFVALLNFTMMGAAVEFTFFGEKIGRKRYPSTRECLRATLIHQSVTGLYETRIYLGDY